MALTKRFTNLTLASKIVLLVALMGAISMAITAYTLANMRSIDQQYRTLIATKARSALLLSEAALLLSDANRLVYAVLTEQEASAIRTALGSLAVLQTQFGTKLEQSAVLLPTKLSALDAIAQQSHQAFSLAGDIVNAAGRWRGDQALRIIHSQFEPANQSLRNDLETLTRESVADFESAALELKSSTTRTIINTAIAVGLGLALVIALSAGVALRQISRPIGQLTRTMERLTDRHYEDTIAPAMTERRDEVGTMANALQVFKDSMQRAERLALEVAASAEAKRLSEQLVDLISAIPGTVFQMQVQPDGWRDFLFISEKITEQNQPAPAALHKLREIARHGFLIARTPDEVRVHESIQHSARTLAPLDTDTLITASHSGPHWIKTLATARRTPDGGTLFTGVWLDVTAEKQQGQALAPAAGRLDAQHMPRLRAGLPSDLLAQRPDIVAAEHQLRAANAQVGAPRAASFPRSAVTGSLGGGRAELGGLFDGGSTAWTFSPSLSLPIFNGGRLKNSLALAEVRRDLAVANYEQTVQQAFRDVSDALAGFALERGAYPWDVM